MGRPHPALATARHATGVAASPSDSRTPRVGNGSPVARVPIFTPHHDEVAVPEREHLLLSRCIVFGYEGTRGTQIDRSDDGFAIELRLVVFVCADRVVAVAVQICHNGIEWFAKGIRELVAE